jgi:hypothetical protein
MKNMSNNQLTARINRFMDRKLPKMVDISDFGDRKVRHSQRQQVEVSDTPYISLAIK